MYPKKLSLLFKDLCNFMQSCLAPTANKLRVKAKFSPEPTFDNKLNANILTQWKFFTVQ